VLSPCHSLVMGDACELVASAMRAFPTDRMIQDQGLGAMGIMACSDAALTRMRGAKVNAAALAVTAMRGFADDREVQEGGITVLSRLGVEGHGQAVVAQGAAELTVAAMRKFPDDKAVQEVGLQLIENLTRDLDCVPKLLAAGARQAVISTMQALKEDPDMQTHGATVLAALAIQEKRVKQVGTDKRGSLLPLVKSAPAAADSTGSREDKADGAADGQHRRSRLGVAVSYLVPILVLGVAITAFLATR
jgi:hypothetical protein